MTPTSSPTNPAPRRLFVDINADLGEGAGSDAELMPLVTSANTPAHDWLITFTAAISF